MSELRPAELADATQMAEIFRAGFESFREWAPETYEPPDDLEGPEEMAQALERDDVWAMVAPADDGIAAYVAIKPATVERGSEETIPGLGHLWMLFVRQEHWGRGLGKKLLAAATEELRRRGFEEARLVTPSGNERSCALYEGAGWHAVSSADEPKMGLRITEYRLKL